MDQIGQTGKATLRGVVAATLTWGTPGNQVVASATGNTATVFTKIGKENIADVSDTKDNGEVIAMHRVNKRTRLTFSAIITGAAQTNVKGTAAVTPWQQDVVVITCADDSQIAGTTYVESANLSETPEGDAVIDFTLIKYSQTFAVIA